MKSWGFAEGEGGEEGPLGKGGERKGELLH